MSNLIFPTLTGLDIKIKRTPLWSTEVLTSESGKEQRAAWWSSPRYRFSLTMNYLRQDKSGDEFSTLDGFFHRHRGQFDSFLFTDPKDSSVTDHGFGVGDGTTAAFQLQRSASGLWTDILGTWPFYSKPRTNLTGFSQDATGTGWIAGNGGTGSAPARTANAGIAPNGTPTASRAVFNRGAGVTSSDSSNLQAPAVLQTAQAYCFSFWARTNDGTTRTMLTSIAGAGAVTITVTPVWQRFSCTYNGAGNFNGRLQLLGTIGPDSTADILIWGTQHETGTTPTAYIPTPTAAAVTVTPAYYPGTGDGFEAITSLNGAPTIYRTDWQGQQQLYPWARTNLCIKSQKLDDAAWTNLIAGTGVAPTVTADYGPGPEGGTTAERIQFNQGAGTTVGDMSVRKTPTMTGLTVGQPVIASFWAKSNTSGQTLHMGGGTINGTNQTFNLTTTLQRFTVLMGNSNVTSGYLYFGLRGTISSGLTADITITDFQVEQNTLGVATSFILTDAAAATVTDYTLNSSGLVTFTAAPITGAVLSWTGSYFYRVRFEQDETEFEREFSRVWGAKTVKLITVK